MKRYFFLAAVAILGSMLTFGFDGEPASARAQEGPIVQDSPQDQDAAEQATPPVVFQAAGPNAASIQSAVDAYRAQLGTLNANVAGSFGSGRREVNWDGVPNNFSAPNNFPPDFFNVNSPRGVVFDTPGDGFQVSANAAVGNIEFANLDPTYSSLFRTFSPQRLFTALDSTVTETRFFVPGSNTPATTSGFGAVFTGVDQGNGGQRLRASTKIEYFDAAGERLFRGEVPASPGTETLSFFGVFFDDGRRIALVRITSGTRELAGEETRRKDLVVMDDFIYGEPTP